MAEEEMVVTEKGEVSKDDKMWGMLSWIPFFGWIAAVIILVSEDKKDRPFMKYNAVQSLAAAVAFGIIGAILYAIAIGCLIHIGWLVYGIILMLKANKGEWVEIPVITDFCKNQGWL
jgi:uncharacterized membrane protein